MAATKATRVRRSAEQLIQDLEARIAEVKARAARKQAKANPTTRFTSQALKSIDKALQACDDSATKQALQEARGALSAVLALDGVVVAHGTAVRKASVTPDLLLDYVTKNPGQRGEQISAALGTDSYTMRPTMQKLIAEKKIKTKGERRAMTYQPA